MYNALFFANVRLYCTYIFALRCPLYKISWSVSRVSQRKASNSNTRIIESASAHLWRCVHKTYTFECYFFFAVCTVKGVIPTKSTSNISMVYLWVLWFIKHILKCDICCCTLYRHLNVSVCCQVLVLASFNH